MILRFTLPDDQSWDPELWQRIGVGPEWDLLSDDFASARAVVADDEDVTISCDDEDEWMVRAVIDAARNGAYGEDVRRYWSAAVEEVRR